MKKFLIISLLLLVVGCLAFSQAKPGGIARQAAMGGGQAGYGVVLNPFIMEDPALLFLNPAYQSIYKDYFWANISGGALSNLSSSNNGYGQQNAGVAFGISDGFALGTILSHDPSAINGISLLLQSFYPIYYNNYTLRTPQNIPAVNNIWEVIASYHVNALDLGIGFMYGWSNSDTDYKKTNSYQYPIFVPVQHDTIETYNYKWTNEASANMFGIRAGAVYDLGNGSSFDISGAVHFDNVTDNKSYDLRWDTLYNSWGSRYSGEYSVSGTELQFNARAKFKVSNKFNFVPYGMFGSVSAEPKEDKLPNLRQTGYEKTWKRTETRELNSTIYAFGAGGEYHTQSFYLAGGVSFQSGSVELKRNYTSHRTATIPPSTEDNYDTTHTLTAEYSYTAIPVFNLGCEWWLTDWLAGRVGYYRSIGNVKQKYEYKDVYTFSEKVGVNPPVTSIETYTGKEETNTSLAHSNILVGGLNPSTFDGLVTLGVGLKFGGFALDATVSEEALRRGFGLIGSNDAINTFGYMTASYNFGE